MSADDPRNRRPFLTARWERLVLANYVCPRALLEPLVPRGTTLDPFAGRVYVSLVGFLFRDTRLRGLPIPFHRIFEEVNLRFYVRRETPEGDRRAVVFVRELVPRWAIASVARWRYNEPYLAVPMSHELAIDAERGGTARYRWRHRGRAFELGATVDGPAQALVAGSEAEFITEHYWGYTRQRDGGTLEYEVQHPSWRVWTANDAWFDGDATALYGEDFARILREPPSSAQVAWGSEVAVYPGVRLGEATTNNPTSKS